MGKEVEANKKIKEIKRRLDEIEKKVSKIEIPIEKLDIKKGFNKIVNILDKMFREDIKDYREIGSKKTGNVKTDYGVRIRFFDDRKKDKKDINWIKKRK